VRCGDPDHLKIPIKGVATWNKWRDRNEKIHPDLEGISFNHPGASPLSVPYLTHYLDDIDQSKHKPSR
jgi:hypothetical protein